MTMTVFHNATLRIIHDLAGQLLMPGLVSDRVLVMYGRRIAGELSAAATEENLGVLMAGGAR